MEATRLLIAAKEKAAALATLSAPLGKAHQAHKVEQLRLCADLENKKLELQHLASSAGGRGARNDSILSSQRLLVDEAQSAFDDMTIVVKESNDDVADVAKRTEEAEDLLKRLSEAAEFTMGPMVKRLYGLLDEFHVQVQAFFQHFIGNHCMKLLKNHERIFSELSEVPLRFTVPKIKDDTGCCHEQRRRELQRTPRCGEAGLGAAPRHHAGRWRRAC